MRTLFIICICCMLSAEIAVGQQSQRENTAREQLHVTINTPTFLTGEYVYYRVHRKIAPFANRFKGSAIAYVELVSDRKTQVFKHRLALENGLGHSDFFLPNSLTSGTYKLLVYTHETLGATTNQFNETDIVVINPYQADQSNVLDASIANTVVPEEKDANNQFNRFKISLNKNQFAFREKVNVRIQNNSAENGMGTYALSVRKKDDLTTHVPKKTAKERAYKKLSNYTPETKGYFLSGKITTDTNGASISNIALAISIPGEDFFFNTTTTDASGNFQFEIPVGIEGEYAYVETLSATNVVYNIQEQPNEHIDYTQLNFSKVAISEAQKEAIVSRSISNQIENAYFSEKPDTVTTRIHKKSFIFYEVGKVYNLKDYTRFRTLEETFTELIPSVNALRNKQGEEEIRVFEKKFAAPTDDLPLFFVDGLWVRNPQQLLALDARTLATIKVIRRGYSFSGQDYFGVLLVTSKDAEKNKTELTAAKKRIALFKPQPLKTYYQQRYDTAGISFEKIPDYRHQLLWRPGYAIRNTQNNLTFFTPDIDGTYEIKLSGVSADGSPIFVTQEFMVLRDDK